MAIVDGLAFGLIAGLIMYNIKRTDEVDSRLDKIDNRLVKLEVLLPKRKTDDRHYTAIDEGWHSDNSGIDL